MHYEPVLRPTFAEFPNDARCYAESDDMMVGAALLAAPVVEPGQTEREVWLPAGVRWTCYWSGEQFEGGQYVTLPAQWDRPVMLVREGSVIALNVAEQQFGRRDDHRAFIVTPFAGNERVFRRHVEDDGETEAWRRGEFGEWIVSAQGDASTLALAVEVAGPMPHAATSVEILLPASESRNAAVSAGRIVMDEPMAGWRRIVVEL